MDIDGRATTALADTGADHSVISETLASILKKVVTPWTGLQVRTAANHLITPVGRCTARIKIRGFTYVNDFMVLPECSRDLILGMDFLQTNGAVIDLQKSRISFSTKGAIASHIEDKRDGALRIVDDDITLPARSSLLVNVKNDAFEDCEGIAEGNVQLLLEKGISIARGFVNLHNGYTPVLVTNFTNERRHLAKGTAIAFIEEVADITHVGALRTMPLDSLTADIGIPVEINNKLSTAQMEALQRLVHDFADCFATSSKVRRTPIAKHRILTDESARPMRQQPYRVSPKEREAIKTQVKEMLNDDVIQPSKSPWASPVVLVKKKDNTLRFCVDYRKLNSVTKRDVYPLPRIDDTLDRLRDAKFFSSLDLKSGYWQIEVDERDREKTAFITPDGLYEFKVLPFGLCSAPATFQRMMDTVLAGLKWQTCLVYLDDVVVFSSSFEEHLTRLRSVLEVIRTAELTIKPEKCHLEFQELKFLGHMVSAQGVRPDPEKTAAVSSFPIPTDKKAVRRFLVLCAYYRRFVEGFSGIAEPLTRLTKSDVPFVWTEAQQVAFEELRSRLQRAPILSHFDENSDTEIRTDACNVGIGAILVQRQQGTERVIAYASRTLSKAETNYSATEKECLAVIWAITKFRPYLYGRPFRAISDHHSLCWLANLKDPSGRLARWSLRLQEYDVTVVYKSGKKHSDADCLSRAPILTGENEMEEDFPFVGVVHTADMALYQQQDADLRPLIEQLRGESTTLPRLFLRGLASYSLRNNVLYKRSYGSQEKLLLVVPSALRSEILRACHDEPSAGHLGVSCTFARIHDRYYWPNLLRSVRQYVRTCRDCQRRKKPPVKPPGFLHPLDPPDAPFRQVGKDLLGPFPTSASGNKWIIVATDYLTRYAETKALPRGTASEVAKFFLEHVVLRHGAPTTIITDRGTAFTAAFLQDVFKLTNSTHRKCTAYHPQTNGLTERLNRTLADMLSMYVDLEHKNWDEILPYATFAYNTAMQETTRCAPFELVYGRSVTTTLDAMLPVDQGDMASTDTDDFTQWAEEARQLARLRIRHQQEIDAEKYNKGRRNVEYRPGDLVWVWTPIRRRGLSEKLLRRYFGPYRVLRRLSDVTYQVLPENTTARSSRRRADPEVVHVVRIKPYYSRPCEVQA